MTNVRSVEKDLEWGIKQEEIVKPRIEKWIEYSLCKTPEYFNIFDFINDEHKIIIEVKSRKNKKEPKNKTQKIYLLKFKVNRLDNAKIKQVKIDNAKLNNFVYTL